MSTQAHTPMPWRLVEADQHKRVRFGIQWIVEALHDDGQWWPIMELREVPRHQDDGKPNAERIVRAVNSHADLLAALADAKNTLSVVLESRELDSTQSSFFRVREARDNLRAAIAKAEGRT